MYGVIGSMETEFEVQRTIKRAELTASLCLLKKITGSTKVHVDCKGILDGLWSASARHRGMLTCGCKICEELHCPKLK